jgi:hypothetical protein
MVKWYQRVSFTMDDDRRKIFRVGDFCRQQLSNTLHYIVQLAVVRFQGMSVQSSVQSSVHSISFAYSNLLIFF